MTNRIESALNITAEFFDKIAEVNNTANEAITRNNQRFYPEYAEPENKRLETQAQQDRTGLFEEYKGKLQAQRTMVETQIKNAFTVAITPEDNATLDMLEKLEVTKLEMQQYAEKYARNQIALRRLSQIARGKGFKDGRDFRIKDLDFYLTTVTSIFTQLENLMRNANDSRTTDWRTTLNMNLLVPKAVELDEYLSKLL